MTDKLNVLTGATGLVGSHVAEQLASRGERVRALVRPSSDTSFLQQLGVEVVVGDLGDADSVRRAVEGADIVYHCAAKVSDWGPWSEFQRDVVDTTRNVMEACRNARVGRVLHVSSVTVYGHPRRREGLFTEDEPLGQNQRSGDHYGRSKVMAEELAWQCGAPVTIVRPSWTYGPRDRTTMPRVLDAIRTGRARIVGTGDNLLNIVYAGDVAEGIILAANHPVARGQAYNLSSEGEATQRQLLDALTEALGMPPVTRRVPYRLVYLAATMNEFLGKALRRAKPPTFTRRGIYLIGRSTQFSIAKARNHLGWQPRTPVREAVHRTLEWIREHAASPALAVRS